MTDQQTGVDRRPCPWCSSDRGADAEGRCTSCGAAIRSEPVSEPLPGVTDVDTLGIIKQRGVRQPNRIVAWVTGDSPETEAWAPAGEALEEPSLDVRREMLKLEFDAAIAAQQAELDAMKAEEALAAAERATRGSVADVPVPTEGDVAAGSDAAEGPGGGADAAASAGDVEPAGDEASPEGGVAVVDDDGGDPAGETAGA
jgi:hypothetical protein